MRLRRRLRASPCPNRYVGRAVAALAADPDRARWNQQSDCGMSSTFEDRLVRQPNSVAELVARGDGLTSISWARASLMVEVLAAHAGGRRVLDLGCLGHRRNGGNVVSRSHRDLSRVAEVCVGADFDAVRVREACASGWDVRVADIERSALDRRCGRELRLRNGFGCRRTLGKSWKALRDCRPRARRGWAARRVHAESVFAVALRQGSETARVGERRSHPLLLSKRHVRAGTEERPGPFRGQRDRLREVVALHVRGIDQGQLATQPPALGESSLRALRHTRRVARASRGTTQQILVVWRDSRIRLRKARRDHGGEGRYRCECDNLLIEHGRLHGQQPRFPPRSGVEPGDGVAILVYQPVRGDG